MATQTTPSSLSSLSKRFLTRSDFPRLPYKKAMLAALAIFTTAGCGPLFPNPPFKWGVDASGADGQASAVAHAGDDEWASSAFAVYGKDAVHTCLAAFRQDLARGEVDSQGEKNYRTQLADFMCNCARGQSAEACPEP